MNKLTVVGIGGLILLTAAGVVMGLRDGEKRVKRLYKRPLMK